MQDPSCLYVDMNINYFADFLFVKNTNDSIIELTLPEIENNKDMFFFLVDLVCKGLILLFGTNNKVDIESIKIDDFKIIKKKMNLAGIKVNLSIFPIENSNGSVLLNLQHIEDNMADNLPLPEYVFTINNVDMKYNISFDLVHVTL